jgi:hypothetical protein
VNAPNSLNSPSHRRILVQGSVVIFHIQKKKHVAQMLLVEDDHRVKAFPPERANQPFRMAEARVIIHPDDWYWGAREHYAWREHEGRGYRRGDLWVEF